MTESHAAHPSSVVETFLENWKQKYAYYQLLAEKVEGMCRDVLHDRGIQCNVTSRYKGQESLRNKLYKRQREDDFLYKDEEHIISDIHDLAGVRIAWYWPKHKKTVQDVLHEILYINDNKPVSDRPEPGRVRRFQWYSAHHYIACLKEEDRKKTTWTETDKVEIQVVSVLRNALAEVEHDTVYKPLSGPWSLEEHNIIDGLSGVIRMGECFLDQLSDAQDRKKEEANKQFCDIYELGSCLSRLVAQTFENERADLGSLKTLLPLLNFKRYDNPSALRKLLTDLRSHEASHHIDEDYGRVQLSMAVRMMDYIIFHNMSEVEKRKMEIPELRKQLRVIFSTFIRLDELFCPASAWRGLISRSCLDDDYVRIDCLQWLGKTVTQDLLYPSEEIIDEDQELLTKLWSWFEQHQERPIQLAFRVCKLVDHDLDKEWHLFTRSFEKLGDILWNSD